VRVRSRRETLLCRYGLAVMTSRDSGGRLNPEVEARVAAAYNWDSLDKSVPR